jgi:hypothetical protein
MILEIGADEGKSLQLWSEYFTRPAGIHGISYGVKIDQKKLACDWNPKACEYVKIFVGDQSDPEFLNDIASKYQYDIIVDDGSHVPAHMLTSFKHLFPALKAGGLYVLEDVETSYWDKPDAIVYGYPIPGAGIGASPKHSVVEKLKQLVDVLMRFHMMHPSLSVLPDDDKIMDITFGQGVVFVRKGTDDELSNPPKSPYAQLVHANIDAWEATARATNP